MTLSQGSAQDPSWHFPLTYSHISCHRQEIIRAPSSRMPHTSSDNYQAPSSWDKRWQIALCCLEGSTMSNLVHRRRRCARIGLHSILCLEGSTPEDRSGASPPGKGYRCGSRGAYFLLPTAAILFSGGLEGPAWQDWELRHRAAAKTRLEQRPMTEGPRRYAS